MKTKLVFLSSLYHRYSYMKEFNTALGSLFHSWNQMNDRASKWIYGYWEGAMNAFRHRHRGQFRQRRVGFISHFLSLTSILKAMIPSNQADKTRHTGKANCKEQPASTKCRINQTKFAQLYFRHQQDDNKLFPLLTASQLQRPQKPIVISKAGKDSLNIVLIQLY